MIRDNQNSIAGLGRDMPPDYQHVVIYFIQLGMSEKDADLFFQQQLTNDWKTKSGTPIRNWKTAACDWIFDAIQAKRLQYRMTHNKV